MPQVWRDTPSGSVIKDSHGGSVRLLELSPHHGQTVIYATLGWVAWEKPPFLFVIRGWVISACWVSLLGYISHMCWGKRMLVLTQTDRAYRIVYVFWRQNVCSGMLWVPKLLLMSVMSVTRLVFFAIQFCSYIVQNIILFSALAQIHFWLGGWELVGYALICQSRHTSFRVLLGYGRLRLPSWLENLKLSFLIITPSLMSLSPITPLPCILYKLSQQDRVLSMHLQLLSPPYLMIFPSPSHPPPQLGFFVVTFTPDFTRGNTSLWQRCQTLMLPQDWWELCLIESYPGILGG